MRRHWLRFSLWAFGPLLLGAAWLGGPGTLAAQEASPASDSPARFVPADGLTIYLEFEGLDAHEAAWRKSAACQVLNDTPTGAMLEDVFAQAYGRYNPGGITGPDALKLAKHVARSGVAIGSSITGPDLATSRGAMVMVFRKAFANKEVRPIFARFLQMLPGPGTKSEPKVVAGHKLVTGKRGAQTFAWWVEEGKKEDLIVVLGPPGAEAVALDVVDGKAPSALTHPARVGLLKGGDGLEAVGLAFLDPQPLRPINPQAAMVRFFQELGANRIDLALGFRDRAVETTTSLHLAQPDGKSALLRTIAKLLGPGFARDALPAVPAGVDALMALGHDGKNLLINFPGVREKLDQVAAQATPKLKIRWQEDLFAHLGPKLTAYLLPGKAGGSGGSILSGAMSMVPGMGAGADAQPKVALLVDVDNPTAFGKALDELMGFANRSLKNSLTPPPGPGGEGAPPPPPGGPRGRGGPPAPEFRLMGGETRSYVLNVPPEMAGMIPAGFRPTIRLGAKQLAIATSADVARQALEAKGGYAPPAEIAGSFGRLPGKLNWLMIADPRDSTPEVLATFPGKLQAALNTIGLPAPPGATPGASTPPAGAPGGGPQPGVRPGMGGPPPAGQPAAPSPLVLNIDSAKLPAADDIRKLLFPAIHTIATEGDVLRITSRVAFPAIPDPAGFAVGYKAGQAMAKARMAGADGATMRSPSGGRDGFFDVPAAPPGRPPGGQPGQPGRPPQRGGGPGVQRPD